jgi:hypothetical protein
MLEEANHYTGWGKLSSRVCDPPQRHQSDDPIKGRYTQSWYARNGEELAECVLWAVAEELDGIWTLVWAL